MKMTLLAAVLAVVGLTACEKTTVNPPATVVTPTVEKQSETPPSTVPVPGPQGPAGPAGEKGEPGKPGDTTVVLPADKPADSTAK
jgi:hypothetical protein